MPAAKNFRSRRTSSQQHLWNEVAALFASERDLVAAAVALGAGDIQPWSQEETALVRATGTVEPLASRELSFLRELILAGADPLGDAICAFRSAETRRQTGATYTPDAIVRSMVERAASGKCPSRVVDPGTGSGRFLLRAAAAFPSATLVGVEIDPVAALIARANLAVSGLACRSRILVGDYRRFCEPTPGHTLYIGNPPYVRHHLIEPKWKEWFFQAAEQLGHKASRLAGLHVHFFLATAHAAQPGDSGAFITAAEWLDVNYGSLVRSLILGKLGGQSIIVIDPTAQPFPDATTTAAITTFEVASKPASVFFRRVNSLGDLGTGNEGRKIHRDRLSAQGRWSNLTRSAKKPPEGYMELGEICRVHRGQATGANDVWIAGEHSVGLPASVLFPTITRAREVLEADGRLDDPAKLRCVVDLPPELDRIDRTERLAIEQFLRYARLKGANTGYIATHRKPWWCVGLRAPAPIISTYMARRPPAFAVNHAGARHINIAHGLYPRGVLSATVMAALVRFLQTNVSQREGRTYAGGLTKFEPREMERLIVPGPAMLAAGVFR
jgi:adenine-specific DNA-methyltransferase